MIEEIKQPTDLWLNLKNYIIYIMGPVTTMLVCNFIALHIWTTTYKQNMKLTLISNGSLFVEWGAQYLLAN